MEHFEWRRLVIIKTPFFSLVKLIQRVFALYAQVIYFIVIWMTLIKKFLSFFHRVPKHGLIIHSRESHCNNIWGNVFYINLILKIQLRSRSKPSYSYRHFYFETKRFSILSDIDFSFVEVEFMNSCTSFTLTLSSSVETLPRESISSYNNCIGTGLTLPSELLFSSFLIYSSSTSGPSEKDSDF